MRAKREERLSTLSDTLSLRVSHVEAGTNERRLYSQATDSFALIESEWVLTVCLEVTCHTWRILRPHYAHRCMNFHIFIWIVDPFIMQKLSYTFTWQWHLTMLNFCLIFVLKILPRNNKLIKLTRYNLDYHTLAKAHHKKTSSHTLFHKQNGCFVLSFSEKDFLPFIDVRKRKKLTVLLPAFLWLLGKSRLQGRHKNKTLNKILTLTTLSLLKDQSPLHCNLRS